MSEEHDQSVSYRAAMHELIGERFGRVWKAIPAAIDGAEPDGVHDVRVASRRLRGDGRLRRLLPEVVVRAAPQNRESDHNLAGRGARWRRTAGIPDG